MRTSGRSVANQAQDACEILPVQRAFGRQDAGFQTARAEPAGKPGVAADHGDAVETAGCETGGHLGEDCLGAAGAAGIDQVQDLAAS